MQKPRSRDRAEFVGRVSQGRVNFTQFERVFKTKSLRGFGNVRGRRLHATSHFLEKGLRLGFILNRLAHLGRETFGKIEQ